MPRLKPPSIADDPANYIPPRSYDLIDDLVTLFPQRCILENESPEAAHRYAGKAELVEELRSWKERELET